MTISFKGRMGAAAGPSAPRTVRIFLKGPSATRDTDMGKKFEPTQRLSTKCSCGTTLHFYTTYPNEKSMPFDREPTVIDSFVRDDGAVIAVVSADQTHFTSCLDLKKERKTDGFSHHAR